MTFPLTKRDTEQFIDAVKQTETQYIWVVSDKALVIRYWQAGLAEAIFEAHDYFDEAKFHEFVSKPDLTVEELRFALKVLVWQATNWQSQSIVDLNISFFGGQYRHAISAIKFMARPTAPVLICDYATFLSLPRGFGSDRVLLLEHMAEFERAVTKTAARKASWGFVSYCLRSIYNPELTEGDFKYKDEVTDLLARADLFFGLVRLLLEPLVRHGSFVTEEQLEERDYEYSRLRLAGEHFIEKLLPLAEKVHNQGLKDFAAHLEAFFDVHLTNVVRWLEIREGYCAFVTQPLYIEENAQRTLQSFPNGAIFLEILSAEPVERYLATRLGIREFTRVLAPGAYEGSRIPSLVGAQKLQKAELFNAIQAAQLPVIVSLPTLAEIKDFYRDFHESLASLGVVYAQGYSGGTNKIIRNFGIRTNSILIVTHDFLSQIPYGSVQPATVLIDNFGSVEYIHPYTTALAKTYGPLLGNDFKAMRALMLFGDIVKRIYQPALTRLAIQAEITQKESLESFLEATGLFELAETDSHPQSA